MKNLLIILMSLLVLSSCQPEELPAPVAPPPTVQNMNDTVYYDVRWMPADSCYTSSSKVQTADIHYTDTTQTPWAFPFSYYHPSADPAPFYGHVAFGAPQQAGVAVDIHLGRSPGSVPPSISPCDLSRFIIYRDSVLVVDTVAQQYGFSEWLQ